MADPTDVRITRMYRYDCAWALVALLALWATIVFVLYKVWSLCSDPQIMLALAIGAGTLLLLNTASVIALVRHYTADKAHLYGLDLFYLDAMRLTKQEARLERK